MISKEMKENILSNRQKTSTLNGWYIVTPELAKALLDLNVANYRSIRPERVNAIAKEIKLGKWKKNGQPIVINKDGVLQDGQHRLHGVIKADTSIICYIVFDADITNVYDLNLIRSIKQMFNSNGIAISNLCIGGGRHLLNYGSGTENHGYIDCYDYIAERLEMLKKCENIISSGYKSTNIVKSVGKKAGCLAVVYCLLKTGEVSEATMREFFTVANSGNTISCTKNPSSALMFRNQMLSIINTGGGRRPMKLHMEIAYRALMEFKQDRNVRKPYSYDTDDGLRLIQHVFESENRSNVA